MKLGKVLIYFGILVALASYVYFVEIRYKKEQQTRKAEAERITKIDKDKIGEVDLTSKDGAKIVVRKMDKNWVMAEPVKVNADQKAVNSLLTSFSDAQLEKIIKEKDVQWKEYDLEKPDFTVTARTRDDAVTLYFGAANPAKTSYYLRKQGDNRLLLVADTLKNSLNKSVFDLREKSVFTVAPSDVQKVVVVRDGKETELKREGPESWTMVKPESFRVKAAEISRGLIGLTNIQAKDIIDEPKKEGDPYGLDKPEYKILLDSKNRKQTLLIGKAVGKQDSPSSKDRYAKIEGQDTVYVIGSRDLTAFKTDPKELRDRSILSFKPKEIHKMEVTMDGKTWLVQKSEKEDTWAMEKPEKKAVVETWPITGILWDLQNLEWKELKKPIPANLAETGLEKPRITVSLYKKDAKEPITLKVGWPEQTAAKEPEPAKPAETTPETAAKPAEAKQEPKQPAEAKEETKPSAESGEQKTQPAETKEPAKESPDKGAAEAKTAPEKPKGPTVPQLVNAIVQPPGHEDALFEVDSGLIGRLRKDVQRIAGEQEKKKK